LKKTSLLIETTPQLFGLKIPERERTTLLATDDERFSATFQ